MGGSGTLRVKLLLAAGILSGAIAVAALVLDVAQRPERDSVDLRFSLRGEQPAPTDIAVVGVDDVTFGALQEQWPFPRRLHARLIDRLVASGAAAIVYDVQFTEPTNRRDDNALIESVREATRTVPVVMTTTEIGPRGQANVFGGAEGIEYSGASVGNGNNTTDAGGVIRRVPYQMQRLPHLAVVGAEAPGDVEADREAFRGEGIWVDFHGPPGTVDTHSFSDVLAGGVDEGALRDRIVVVGATAPSLQDIHPTSVGGDELMPGPEVVANAISTVRRDAPLRSSSAALGLVLIAVMAMLTPLAAILLSPLAGLAVAAAGGIGYAVGAQLAFNSGLIVPLVVPLTALLAATVATVTIHYATAALDRRRVRDIFARFVPEAVVDQVLEGTDDDLRLGGVQTTGTVLFSDVRGFTTFSESHEAKQVLEILNRYLSAMTDTILEHGGTLTTYIGDGIMAVFGAPIEQDDHADRAIATARAMLEREMPRFNDWLAERGVEPFAIGVGLNSGEIMAGNVGSERRLEYTAIGDTVNTAARLEGMTKGTGHSLFLADSTREASSQADQLTPVGELAVRGRKGAVKVWTLSPPGQHDAGSPAPD